VFPVRYSISVIYIRFLCLYLYTTSRIQSPCIAIDSDSSLHQGISVWLYQLFLKSVEIKMITKQWFLIDEKEGPSYIVDSKYFSKKRRNLLITGQLSSLWIILHTFVFVNIIHLDFILLSGNNEKNSFENFISFDHLRSSDLSSDTVIIPTSKLKKTPTHPHSDLDFWNQQKLQVSYSTFHDVLCDLDLFKNLQTSYYLSTLRDLSVSSWPGECYLRFSQDRLLWTPLLWKNVPKIFG